MKKQMCLVLLRLLPEGGSKFRRWFCHIVCTMVWDAYDREARPVANEARWTMPLFILQRIRAQVCKWEWAERNRERGAVVEAFRLQRDAHNYWSWNYPIDITFLDLLEH